MRIILTLILVSLKYLDCLAQAPVRQPKLRSLIDSLYIIDQQIQHDVMTAKTDSARQHLLPLVQATFLRHQRLLAQVIDQYGYPGFQLVGAQTSQYFFVLVQHCDSMPHFQRRVLRLLHKAVKKKDAEGKWYGYLVDRVALNTGKKQVYGTQIIYDGQQALPRALRKPKTVNERRAKLGMETLEVYLARATEFHHQINKH